jgi:hypothetical protein
MRAAKSVVCGARAATTSRVGRGLQVARFQVTHKISQSHSQSRDTSRHGEAPRTHSRAMAATPASPDPPPAVDLKLVEDFCLGAGKFVRMDSRCAPRLALRVC